MIYAFKAVLFIHVYQYYVVPGSIHMPPPPPYRGLFGLNHPPTLYPSGNLTSFVQHLEVGQKYFTAEILSHSSLVLKM